MQSKSSASLPSGSAEGYAHSRSPKFDEVDSMNGSSPRHLAPPSSRRARVHPSLKAVGLIDILDSDPRPAFVVALPSTEGPLTSQIIHHNPALAINATLLFAVLSAPENENHATFWSWISSASSPNPLQSAAQYSLSYFGSYWTKVVVQGRWIVVSGNEGTPSSEPPRKIRVEAGRDGHPTPRRRGHEHGTPTDFPTESRRATIFRAEQDPALILPDFTPDPEPFYDVIRSVDWEHSPLGPMDKWPFRLHQMFNLIVPDSRPSAIYWGPEHTVLYNEAFSKFAGKNHPAVLGKPLLDSFPHLKERVRKVSGVDTGKCVHLEDESRFFIAQADGTGEETYCKWSMGPIMDDRKCVAIQHSLLDTTSMRLWERRMKTLLSLGDSLVAARDVKSYWLKTLEELGNQDPSYDVPLAFLYSVSESDDDQSSYSRYDCPRVCRLEGSLGVPDDHPIAPATLLLRETDEGLAPMIREALDASSPLLLQVKDGSLPEPLLRDLQWRGFGDACQAGVICPIRPTRSDSVMGILFLGINPRRPYDNDYRQYTSLLCQKLASQLAATVLLEEETRRGRNAAQQAAYDTAMLQRKLAYQMEQTNRSIHNFKAIAEFIPVGTSFSDAEGNVTFANDAWYRITGHPDGDLDSDALATRVVEEDRQIIAGVSEKLKEQDVVSYEFRIIPDEEPDGDEQGLFDLTEAENPLDGHSELTGRHILALAKAERNTDGSVVRVLTCLTDVTKQKHTAEAAIMRAQESENLKRLAELSTVAMYDMSIDGRLLSANKSFWELSGLPKADLRVNHINPWSSCVAEQDLPVLEQSLERLRTTERPQTAEIKLKAPWTPDDTSTVGYPEDITRWALASFIPVRNSEGVVESFTGCLVDVSLQKWQLEQEKQRKDEAINSKRQQENFIDMTSHEMRNPLSAIVHCTDAIIASLARALELFENFLAFVTASVDLDGDTRSKVGLVMQLVRDSIENAEIIVECAQHQKRIVDDILTMSKLDSKLLTVTPFTVDPIEIMKDAVKMFEVEARRVDISLTSTVDDSYMSLGHGFLDFDPSRVKQVLINLLTNALKFTKTGKTRSVEVRLKGSFQIPAGGMTAVDFIPRFCDPLDEYEQPALKGRSDPVYLLFEVKDTGQGLTATEMRTLFNRFVQASAKTHVKYGGSGLGLFICRRLTELQNGAIGVSSEPGVGSTFAFFIESYIPSDEARKGAEATAAAANVVATVGNSAKKGRTLKQRQRAGLDGQQEGDDGGGGGDEGPPVRVNGILVVEDNLINQQITRRGLTERGYSVDVANHGLEAVAKLRRSREVKSNREASSSNSNSNSNADANASRPPTMAGSPKSRPSSPVPIPVNLVLMDIEMPVQDGLTCTRQIRELEASGEIFCAAGGPVPIIAVTANARPEQITEAKEAGCNDVLVKPYRIPELVEKMQIVIRRMGGI